MQYTTRRRGTLRDRDVPRLCRRSDEHLTNGRTRAAKRIPIRWSGSAAAGALRSKFRFVEIGLLDANVFPVHIEFVRKNHGQMSFHALTNLGILGQNSDHAVLRNTEERHWRIHRSRSGRASLSAGGLSKDLSDGTGVTCNKNPATSYGCHAKKATTVEKCGLHEYLAMRRGVYFSAEAVALDKWSRKWVRAVPRTVSPFTGARVETEAASFRPYKIL